MTVPTPLPEPSQSPNWAAQLNAAITDRYEDAKQAAADVADTINTGRLSETELEATFLPKTDTGAAGLAVLAANLPAEAREALGITVDTSVGTRVFVGGVMVYGDTGWRDITSLLMPHWTTAPGDVLRARRLTSSVELYGRIRRAEATGGRANYAAGRLTEPTLPAGFAGLDTSAPAMGIANVGLSYGHVNHKSGTLLPGVAFRGDSAQWAVGDIVEFAVSWPTATTWPTTLPGTPV